MRRNLKKCKKGNVFDMIFIGIIITVTIIISVIFGSVSKDLKTDLESDGFLTTNESKEAMALASDSIPGWIDNGVLFLLSGLIIFTIVSSMFINTHPIFFVGGFLLLLVSGFLWVSLEESAGEVIGSDGNYTSVLENQMPNSKFILNNLFKIMMTFPFLIMAVLFAKSRLNMGAGGGAF